MHKMHALIYILLLFTSMFSYSENIDNFTEKLNSLAKSACESNESRTINFGHGDFYFKSSPDPFPCALNIKGDGIGSTKLIRQYQGGTFLVWKRGIDHSGGSIRDVTILAGDGTNKGIAILIQAETDTDNKLNSYNRHTFTIEHVTIGRVANENTSWDNGIYLDGSQNPDNNNGIAPGIRMTEITNVTISGTNVSQIYLNKARGANLLNVDCFIPLNNSINGVYLDNNTWGVKLDSRSCQYKFIDNESNWMLYNGQRIK